MGRRGVRSRGIAVPATVRAVFATAALLAFGLLPPASSAALPDRLTSASGSVVSAPAGSQFQSDAAHTGVQTGSGIAPPLGIRWHVTIPTHPSYAIVGAGHVYVTYDLDPTHEALLALNEADGSTFFGPVSLGPEYYAHRSGLAFDGNRVFTITSTLLVDAMVAGMGVNAS